MARSWKWIQLPATCLLLAGCGGPSYSPNIYAGNAVQLANKVDSGTIVGFRQVIISSNGNVGAVAGGAAGGVLGGEYGKNALAALGGAAVGAVTGTIGKGTGSTDGWEYIVRKDNGEMLSVTQREKDPLLLGQRVLVINGQQARVVADYSMAPAVQPSPKEKAEAKPDQNVKVEVVLSVPPGMTAQPSSEHPVTPVPPDGTWAPLPATLHTDSSALVSGIPAEAPETESASSPHAANPDVLSNANGQPQERSNAP